MENNLIDAKSAAEICGVKRVTIYKWVTTGKLKCVRLYGRIMFTREQIDDLLTKKERKLDS